MKPAGGGAGGDDAPASGEVAFPFPLSSLPSVLCDVKLWAAARAVFGSRTTVTISLLGACAFPIMRFLRVVAADVHIEDVLAVLSWPSPFFESVVGSRIRFCFIGGSGKPAFVGVGSASRLFPSPSFPGF